ncbi:MAG: GNAT family N-acetyltransferase [Clostridia bacterium]|nr:GNAT family N-acetyltransferase [Clostridia bacterium]
MIETERLILRPWQVSDAGDLYELAKDDRIGPAAGWKPHKSVEESENIIKAVLSEPETYAVCLKETGKPVGSLGIMPGETANPKRGKNEAEIGYWIGVEYWGQGLIPEAVRGACRYAFEELGMEALWCGYFDGNEKSKRVQEKCGFKYVNTERLFMSQLGEYRLVHCTKLTREDWQKMQEYVLRPEEKADEAEVENLVRESFWNVYRPGCSEHYVIHVLRDDPAFVKELDFVMELGGRIIGQNIFMRTFIDGDDGRKVPVLTMGPICIANDLKRKGYGKIILDYSLKKAAKLGYGAVLFEGNIKFYGKSGFTYAKEFGIRYHDLPEGADDSFFLCRELIPGYLKDVTGVYNTPMGYYVDDKDVEEFDRQFPPKQKLKLPGQLFD